jgi:hypothetical protein
MSTSNCTQDDESNWNQDLSPEQETNLQRLMLVQRVMFWMFVAAFVLVPGGLALSLLHSAAWCFSRARIGLDGRLCTSPRCAHCSSSSQMPTLRQSLFHGEWLVGPARYGQRRQSQMCALRPDQDQTEALKSTGAYAGSVGNISRTGTRNPGITSPPSSVSCSRSIVALDDGV